MWISGPGYRGSRDYWQNDEAQGYGNSRWWVSRYPWAATMLPYQQWYIWDSWLPQYTVSANYAVQLQRGLPLSGGALVYDRVHFPRDMPVPPSFADSGINVNAMRIQKQADELGASERDTIEEGLNSINTQLSALRRDRDIMRWQSQGYMLVPDLDTLRFTWVKNAAKSDLASRHRGK